MTSELESSFLAAWRAFAPPDAPQPVEQHRFCPKRRYAFDFAWLDAMVAVEIDGGQWAPHGGRHATDADRWKLNTAASLGWRVLRFSGSMLAAPETCIRVVLDALRV